MQPAPKNFLITKKEKSFYMFLDFFLISGEQSKFSQYLIFLLSEIQYLSILLWAQASLLAPDAKDPTFVFVRNFSKIMTFECVFQDKTSFVEVFLALIWLYFILFSLFLGYLGFKASKGETVKESIKTTFCSSFQYHCGFIFWIVNIVLMILLSSRKRGLELFSLFSTDDEPFYVISILIIIFNYAFGTLTAIFCFDPFCSNNVFATQTPVLQLLNFIFKAVSAPLIVFASPQETYTRLIYVITAFLFSLGRSLYLHNTFPFHHYQAMRIAVMFITASSWISITNIFAIIWVSKGDSVAFNPIFLIILPLPILIKFSTVRLQGLVEFYMSANTQTLQTKRQILRKLFSYRLLEKNIKLSLNDNISLNRCEIYFVGELIQHSKVCEDPECLCSMFLRDKSKKNNNNVINTKAALLNYFQIINHSFLSEAIKKIKDNNDLKISLAHSIFSSASGSLSPALIYLFSTSEHNLNFFNRMKRKILAKKIQDRMRTQSNEYLKGAINWAEFVDYHSDTTDFLAKIAANTERYLNFWDMFKRPDMKMIDMIKKSNEIEEAADKIDKLWGYFVEKYETFYRLMKDAYKMYLILVRNAPFTSRKMVKKFQWRKNLRDTKNYTSEITEDDLVLSKVISFYVSMNREKIGRVLYVSDNINNSLGYNQQEVIGKNINFLMPSSFAEKHDQIMLKHLDRSKTSVTKDYYTTNGFLKTRGGTILPCSIHISIFPYIQKELVYIGVIKVLATKFDYIILDSSGYIDSFTKDVGQKLNLTMKNRTNIREVCTEDILNQKFETKTIININQSARTEANFLHKEQSINLNMSMNSNKYSPNQKDDTEKEIFEPITNLTFVKQGFRGKYLKFDTKITKKVLLNKKIYILEMENSLDGDIEYAPETRKSSIEDFLNKDPTEESQLNIPPEMPLPGDIFATTENLPFKTNFTRYLSQKTETFTEKLPTIKKMGMTDSSENILFSQRVPTNNVKIPYTHMKSDSKKDMNVDSNMGLARQKTKSIKSVKYFNKFFEMQSERGSQASTAHKLHPKLEKAIYSLPVDKSTQILKFVALVFILTCIVLLLIFQINTENNLQLVKGNVSVITTSNLRLFQIAEINRRTRALSLYENGLIDDKRYTAYRLRNVKSTVLSLLISIQQNLNTYNNQVRAALNKIEPSLQIQFYNNPIPIIGLDPRGGVQYLNTFDAVTSIIVKAKQLMKYTATQIKKDNPEMNFILNNTLNELLLTSEQVTSIILDDNDYKLDFLRNLIIFFIIASCFFGAIMLSLFFYNQIHSIQSRNKFIELFLRLNQEEVDQNINQVKSFKTGIAKNGLNFRYMQLDDFSSSENLKSPTSRAAKSFRLRRRGVNMKGVNNKILLAQLFAITLFLFALTPFIYISIIVSQKKDIIKQEVSTIVQVNTHLYDLNLISSSIYEYIQFNGTTKVRTRPIEEEWENTFSRLSRSQEFFSKLFETKDGKEYKIDPELHLLLTGYLCTAMNTSELVCSLGKGVLDNGIIGMNSFVLLTLRRVKDMYDTSKKSLTNSKDALSFANLIDIEYLYAIMQLPAYEKLGKILQTRVELHIQEVEDLLKMPVVISVVLYIVLGYIISNILFKLILEERTRWRKMFRKIPFNIVITDKIFKSYLVKESNHMLDSIKSQI